MSAVESSTTECKVAQQDVASKLLKLLEEYEGYFSVLSDKVSNIELRQSRSSGETDDSIRAVQQWAQADSSCLPRKALQQVAEMMTTESPTYYQAFLNKDLRSTWIEYRRLLGVWLGAPGPRPDPGRRKGGVQNSGSYRARFVYTTSAAAQIRRRPGGPGRT